MVGIKYIAVATAIYVGGLVGLANAEENLERTRIESQPYVGMLTESIQANNYRMKCGDEYIVFVNTSQGRLFYISDNNNKPYLQLKENGTPKQNPYAFIDINSLFNGDEMKVYVNVDGDNKYDFSQSSALETPCEVIENLDKYNLKDKKLEHSPNTFDIHIFDIYKYM